MTNANAGYESNLLHVATAVNTEALRAVDALSVGRVGKIELDLGEFSMTITTRKTRKGTTKTPKTAKKVAKKTTKKVTKKVAKKVTRK